MRKAFISARFRHPEEAVMEENMRKAIRYGELISQMINHTEVVVVHPMIAQKWGLKTANVHGGPIDEEIVDFNLSLLEECDVLYVCGDDISHGMQEEIDFAMSKNIPVVYVSSDFFDVAEKITKFKE